MYHYPKAARGILLLFISIILSILSGPLSALGIGLLVSILSILLQLAGLFLASQDDDGYRIAFFASIVTLVLNIIPNFLKTGSVVETLLTSISSIISLFIIYKVITITMYLLLEKDPNTSNQGQTVLKIYVVCFCINFICGFLELAPFIGLMAHVISIFASLVQIGGYVLFMVFLFRASQSLK